MPGAVTIGSMCTGHGCFAPRPVITGNPKVLIEGIPASCIGDMLMPHACGPLVHPGNLASGSPKVMVSGRALSRVADLVNCGSFMATGAIKVRVDEAMPIPQVPSQVTMPDGSVVEIPPSYQGVAAYAITYEAGKYAMFDEEEEIAATPSTLREDTPVVQNTKPPVKDVTPSVPASTSTSIASCANITTIDYNMNLSTHFKLADFTTKALFKHTLQAQAGFTEKQLVCNLQGLAQEVLEKIWAQYPGFRINSGFRTFTVGKSQHEKGQACDIQWPGITNQEYKNRALWIRANCVYDQLLFEHGNMIWIHVSYNRNNPSQRKDVKTMFKGKFEPGIVLYY